MQVKDLWQNQSINNCLIVFKADNCDYNIESSLRCSEPGKRTMLPSSQVKYNTSLVAKMHKRSARHRLQFDSCFTYKPALGLTIFENVV